MSVVTQLWTPIVVKNLPYGERVGTYCGPDMELLPWVAKDLFFASNKIK